MAETTIGFGLKEQLEQVQTLMASLHIESDNETQNEDTEFVYNYSSDEEHTSSRGEDDIEDNKKHMSFAQQKARENLFSGNYTPNKKNTQQRARENLFSQNFVPNKKNEKLYTKISDKYKPRPNNHTILDLDCSDDVLKEILRWTSEITAEFLRSETLQNLGKIDAFEYIRSRTTGNANQLLLGADPEQIKNLVSEINSNIELIDEVAKVIEKEFLGTEITDINGGEYIIQEAFWSITNLRICNMCYLDNYVCEFSKYYYKLDNTRKQQALDLFFNKLPKTVANEATKYYTENLSKGIYQNTLGGKISAIKHWLKIECQKKEAKREAKISLCCSKQNDRINEYGCNSSNSKKYKKYKKLRKIPYKKYINTPKNKRKNFFREKKNYCPSGKKKCTCWLCHEEGHYANKCPKKQNKKEEVKMAIDLDLEPIYSSSDEENISYSIYEIVTDNEYSSEEEN